MIQHGGETFIRIPLRELPAALRQLAALRIQFLRDLADLAFGDGTALKATRSNNTADATRILVIRLVPQGGSRTSDRITNR